jgi:hypothetical protein
MKFQHSTLSLLIIFLSACDAHEAKSGDKDVIKREYLDEMYLADDVHFPKDTIVLKKFQLSDSSAKKKLLLHFKNDSLFLSNYGFDGWYGKWFCNFRSAKATFGESALSLHAHIRPAYKPIYDCDDPWQKIEFQIVDSTEHSMTVIKTSDTTSCERKSILRFIVGERGRGGRDYASEGGKKIRTDIQLR